MTGAEKKFLKRKANVFKALGHPTRLWIMERLARGEACVCEFVKAMEVDFSTISAHLAVLQKAGLISGDKRGREVYYSSRMPCVYEFIGCLESVLKSQLAETLEILNLQEDKNGNQSLRAGLQKVPGGRKSCAGGGCRTGTPDYGD